MSKLLKVELSSIEELDDRVAKAFDQHMKRVGQDCMDRPTDKTARTVTLVVRITPIPHVDATSGRTVITCTEVETELEVFSKIPTQKSSIKSLALRPNACFAFNPDSPDNVNQATLLEDDDDA
jgi:hypothetical protein